MTSGQIDIEEAISAADPFWYLPKGHFSLIAADPPWRFVTWSEKNQTRAAANHYDVMNLDEIKALPVGELAATNSVLLLWAINPMIPHALDVMAAWGFTYRTIGFCWTKTTRKTQETWAPKFHFGLGHWSRANIEICLLGTRGKPKRISKGVRQLIVAPVREHSRKPDEFYSRAEQLCSGPYLDLFSREARPEWASFGNETQKFNGARLDVGVGCRA